MLHVYFVLKKLDTRLRVRIGILFSLPDLGFSIMATAIVAKKMLQEIKLSTA